MFLFVPSRFKMINYGPRSPPTLFKRKISSTMPVHTILKNKYFGDTETRGNKNEKVLIENINKNCCTMDWSNRVKIWSGIRFAWSQELEIVYLKSAGVCFPVVFA